MREQENEEEEFPGALFGCLRLIFPFIAPSSLYRMCLRGTPIGILQSPFAIISFMFVVKSIRVCPCGN